VKVALDTRVLADPALADRGIGRYVRELAGALPAAGVEVEALRDLRRPWAPGRVAEGWDHLLLGRDARAAGADLLHSPSVDGATVRPGLPYVVTLHDLVPLKQPSRYLRTGLKHRLRYAAVRGASRVIVPTRAVADEAADLLGLERVDVVAEAPAAPFRPVAAPRGLLARLRLPERFLLWVGGLDPPDPRKGVEELARRAAAGDSPPLVLAGRHEGATATLAAEGRVVLAGRVDDDELAALYSAADALVLPSSDEGFGLTPHEALACGTPVAAYALPALAETLSANPAVRLVPPGDLDALLAAAGELAGTEASGSGRTWADVARETVAVYERAVGEFTTPDAGDQR
jgi:glycosyltransferase involved in cell wall biosynthesis